MKIIKRITTIILLTASICVYAQQSTIKVHKDKMTIEHPSKILVDMTAHNQISAELFEHRNFNVVHRVGAIQLKKTQSHSYPSLLMKRGMHGASNSMMMPASASLSSFTSEGNKVYNENIGTTRFTVDRGSFSNDIFSSNDFVNTAVMAKAGDTPSLPGEPGAPLGDIFIPFILLLGVYLVYKKK